MVALFAPGYPRPNILEETGFDIQVGAPNALTWRPLGGYVDAEFEFEWATPSFATIRIMWDHPLAGYLAHPRRKVIHIRTSVNGETWDGRVMHAETEGRPGREILTLTCVSNQFWLLRGLAWVNNLFPPEFQIGLTGKQDIEWGPSDMVFKNYVAKVMTRLRKPVYAKLPLRYEIPELPDLADIATLDDLLGWVDSSTEDLIVLSARFTPLDELFKQEMTRLELGYSIRLYTPADGPSPWVFNTDNLAQLQSIFDYTSDNFLNFLNPGNILGLADPDAWGSMNRAGYVFDTHKKRDMQHLQFRTDGTQIEHIRRKESHLDAHRVAIGGKAPDILNSIIEWGANFAIQLLLNAILPGLGLGSLLDGLFDDIFFAYQQFWDDEVESDPDLGEHAFGEVFGDNTSAYSLDSFAIGQAKLIEHSGSESLEITVTAGAGDRGYRFGGYDDGRHYKVGDIVTLWDRGVSVEQWISKVKVTDKRDGRMVETITLGDAESIDSGWSRVMARVNSLAATSRAIANSTS